ncbi:MAG: ImmA/IrrE family metallo-endopeptidase [Clostridia bacterium]|nr:ImmA/IrrE family metallo-endopeptidase [Clostridia bacterium]
MADFNYICSLVENIRSKYDQNNPFRLCDEMGIITLFAPMGDSPVACKGFFLTQSRIKSITINSDLSEDFQRIICAHELGHAMLHRDRSGVNAFHDFSFFDGVDRLEYEANIFAAEFLLPDDEVLKILNDDLSFFQAAAKLYVPAELLDFKFRTLKWKGYKVIEPPLNATGNFLKKVHE